MIICCGNLPTTAPSAGALNMARTVWASIKKNPYESLPNNEQLLSWTNHTMMCKSFIFKIFLYYIHMNTVNKIIKNATVKPVLVNNKFQYSVKKKNM